MKFELTVSKLAENTETSKNKQDETTYSMDCVATDGNTKVTIKQDQPFEGFDYEDPVVVEISNPQTKLKK